METNKKLKKGAVVSDDTIALTGFIQKIVPIFWDFLRTFQTPHLIFKDHLPGM